MDIRTYGIAKLREHIRSDVSMARVFEDLLRSDERFEVVVPENFALQETKGKADEVNRELMERLNRSGRAYLAHTVVGGRFVLRFAVGSTLQEERHVRSAWELIQKTTTEMLEKSRTSVFRATEQR